MYIRNDNFNSFNSNYKKLDRVSLLYLNNLIRQLWTEHISWARIAILSLYTNAPDIKFVTDRLYRNADDFGALFSDFYGPEIGKRIAKLMTEHLAISIDLVHAIRDNDKAKINELDRRWYLNADAIADALNSINPGWNKQIVKNMMYDHLDLTKREIIDVFSNKYRESIATYDEKANQAALIADMLLEGLLLQFPNIIVK